jgi:type VI secretion system secreted protein VgrG
MPSVGQETRVARLATAFGKDVLVLVEFDGVEGLSELFDFVVEAWSETELDFDQGLGKPASVHIKDKTGTERHFHGILAESVWRGSEGGFERYRLTIRPWLWLLTHTTDCRIFHDMKVPDIIDKVFSEYGFARREMKLTEVYPKREYCVQYRESDFDFVSRLMEEEGIYYFFRHQEDEHTLVLADAKSSHAALPKPKVYYVSIDDRSKRDEDSLSGITVDRRFCSGKVKLEDFDYMKPSTKLTGQYELSRKHEAGQLERFDYPGRYVDQSVGDRLARVLLEAAQATDKVHHATGDAVGLTPGFLFTLAEHPVASVNAEYLVVRCRHSVVAQDYRSGGGGSGEIYSGAFDLLPSSVPFRAPRMTPHPRISGPQTAIVVDERDQGSKEIEVDKNGRILVRFHWDYRKDLSRRVRIAQTWAAKKWGTMAIPRVGQEVVVEFLEGDPDQPLVVGAVYNASNMPPYDLPKEQTRTVFKSNSSTGGNGYNEITIDDNKGKEEILIHAQKDYNTTVLNKETRTIGKEFPTPEGSNARETVLLKGDDKLELKTGSAVSKIGADVKTDVVRKIEITAGTSIAIKANTEISLTVGSSSIKITPDGVAITGAAQVKIDGGAMLIEKAGIIKLN